MKATATFTPQAWVRDYAIDVDPEGPTEWVTEFEGLTHEQAEAILETGHDNFDLLKEDPAAPMWVREWSGPFEIHVSEAHEDPYLSMDGIEARLLRNEDGEVYVQIDTPTDSDIHERLRVYMNEGLAVRWGEP